MKLTEIVKSQSEAKSGIIEELKIDDGSKVMIKLMIEDAEPINLHYEDEDDTFKGYSHCLGEGCPFCLAGFKPSSFILLPVFSVSSNKICVLRISNARGPHRLLPMICRFLTDPDVSQTILTVSRDAKYRYKVEAQNKSEYASIGVDEVADYVRRVEANEIDIRAIFPKYTDEELRGIPSVRRRLNVLEGKLPSDGIET